MKPDFTGYATRVDMKCSDGVTIKRGAFENAHGTTVPLVWNHQHDDVTNVLGHADLIYQENGDVKVEGYYNETENGQYAKAAMKHGDLKYLSIFANHVRKVGQDVVHGEIKEVSLVLAGANPGAYIEYDSIAHSENSDECSATIFNITEEICHNDIPEKEEETIEHSEDKTIMDVINTMNDKQKALLFALIAKAKGGEIAHADSEDGESDESDESAQDILDSMTAEQKKVVFGLVGTVLEANKSDDNNNKGDNSMAHNVFEGNVTETEEGILTHAEQLEIIRDMKTAGSLRESCLRHDATEITYGIENIDYLFPDNKAVSNVPYLKDRKQGWVAKVMNGVHHTPFSRIKSLYADITGEKARALGYKKGNMKKEEVIAAYKRTTDPTTIYKKQKLDRDDILDITDFDVVAWLKSEMRGKLNEEIARAILVGDGRPADSDDHIDATKLRPIWTDNAVYTINRVLTLAEDADAADMAKAFIKDIIRARKDYRGSGEPTLFCGEDILTECLLLEDGLGHDMYDSVEKLATKLRVKEIVSVPVMDGLKREVSGEGRELLGIVVNLNDYNVGADKGGSVNMFEDFDIDYNQEKYLIETRISGALTIPDSAIVIEIPAELEDDAD